MLWERWRRAAAAVQSIEGEVEPSAPLSFYARKPSPVHPLIQSARGAVTDKDWQEAERLLGEAVDAAKDLEDAFARAEASLVDVTTQRDEAENAYAHASKLNTEIRLELQESEDTLVVTEQELDCAEAALQCAVREIAHWREQYATAVRMLSRVEADDDCGHGWATESD
jgi:chromosome segregation ATPase